MKNFSNNLFLYSIFFLASAPLISSLLIIFSYLLNFNFDKKNYFKDIWSIILFSIGILLIISAVYNFHNNSELIEYGWNKWESFYGLTNWIPLFILFPYFQFQVNSNSKREKFMKYLLAGSIPVIVTGLAQYFLKVYGPFYTFNKLIIWFMKDISQDQNYGLSGLFSNQNYAAVWLGHIFPLSVVLIFKKKNHIKQILNFILISLIVLCLTLTKSRGVFFSFFLTINTFISIKFMIILAIPMLVIFVFPLITFFTFLPEPLINFLKLISPNFAMEKYSEYIYQYGTIFPRLKIFAKSFEIISERPIFGWGAFSVPILFYKYDFLVSNSDKVLIQHSHNIVTEISLNYGLIASISIILFIVTLAIISGRFIFINQTNSFESKIDKAWMIAFIILALNQLVDLTFYDLRINISLWIFIAGLRSIIRENNLRNYQEI